MTIKKRTGLADEAVLGDTTATVTVGLGAAFAKILKLEIKGDDTNVDTTAALTVLDRDNRVIFYSASIDFGQDDSSATAARQTGQTYSTFGLGIYPVPVETEVIDRLGDPSANTEGVSPAIVAESPLRFNFTSIGAGDKFECTAFVEV